LTFSPTFWTFTVNSFSGYENDSILMNINILLWWYQTNYHWATKMDFGFTIIRYNKFKKPSTRPELTAYLQVM